MKNDIRKYVLIAFSWTWALWLTSLGVALLQNKELSTSMVIFDLLAWKGDVEHSLVAQVLFALGVFGPLVGYVAMKAYRPLLGKPSWLTIGLTIGVPLISLLPALILSILVVTPNSGLSISAAWLTIVAYFVSNLITSGTEEFGWRGYLYPALKKIEKDFWRVSLKGGIIWAIWHLPLMFILYWSLGLAIVGILAGFVASIVAMSYITNVVYEKSNSLILTMLLHALNNTATFALVLLFPETPFVIIVALMAWVIVAILEKSVVKRTIEV